MLTIRGAALAVGLLSLPSAQASWWKIFQHPLPGHREETWCEAALQANGLRHEDEDESAAETSRAYDFFRQVRVARFADLRPKATAEPGIWEESGEERHPRADWAAARLYGLEVDYLSDPAPALDDPTRSVFGSLYDQKEIAGHLKRWQDAIEEREALAGSLSSGLSLGRGLLTGASLGLTALALSTGDPWTSPLLLAMGAALSPTLNDLSVRTRSATAQLQALQAKLRPGSQPFARLESVEKIVSAQALQSVLSGCPEGKLESFDPRFRSKDSCWLFHKMAKLWQRPQEIHFQLDTLLSFDGQELHLGQFIRTSPQKRIYQARHRRFDDDHRSGGSGRRTVVLPLRQENPVPVRVRSRS